MRFYLYKVSVPRPLTAGLSMTAWPLRILHSLLKRSSFYMSRHLWCLLTFMVFKSILADLFCFAYLVFMINGASQCFSWFCFTISSSLTKCLHKRIGKHFPRVSSWIFNAVDMNYFTIARSCRNGENIQTLGFECILYFERERNVLTRYFTGFNKLYFESILNPIVK